MTQKIKIVGTRGYYCDIPGARLAAAASTPARPRAERKCPNCGTPMSQCGMPYSSDRAAHREGWCRDL